MSKKSDREIICDYFGGWVEVSYQIDPEWWGVRWSPGGTPRIIAAPLWRGERRLHEDALLLGVWWCQGTEAAGKYSVMIRLTPEDKILTWVEFAPEEGKYP